MKITWLNLNSSYSHASLALPLLHGACRQARVDAEWSAVSATINDAPATALARLLATDPDIVAATAYLFTVKPLLEILRRLAKLRPKLIVVLGGPEFLGNNESFLRREPAVSAVVRGEGEVVFPQFVEACRQAADWSGITGLCWLDPAGVYHDNGLATLVADLDAAPCVVTDPWFETSKPFIQIETARGCPSGCLYCTSARQLPLRYVALERVRTELSLARQRTVREVRILDRTFNASPTRTAALLNLFCREFPDIRFHLEIHPASLGPGVRQLLAAAGPEQFHLEAGLQTSNPAALACLERSGDADQAWDGLEFLCETPNLPVHVDLLAGLPQVTLNDVFADLERLCRLGPDEIQLETLKILPGTPLAARTSELGIVAAPDPPYEVLQTPTMTFDDLEQARLLSQAVDAFYNAPQLQRAVQTAVAAHPGFWPEFLRWLQPNHNAGGHNAWSLVRRFQVLHDFARQARLSETMAALEYDSIRYGLASRLGLCSVAGWKNAIPATAVQLEGKDGLGRDVKPPRRVWMADIGGHRYWFVFTGDRHRASAIYENSQNI